MLLWVLLALVSMPLPAQEAQQPAPSELRDAYFAAVESKPAIEVGLELVARLADLPQGDAPEPPLLKAYEGTLITLRAKHAFWPGTRLRHMDEGLALLDEAVEERPDHIEIRYLRLMSCYYLPGILGRGWSVREDFAALARLLPRARGLYPADLYRTVVRFVEQNGRLQPHELAPLQRVLNESKGE